MIGQNIPAAPEGVSLQTWQRMWNSRKDWTYFSRRTPIAAANTAFTQPFFNSIADVTLDNIPAPSQLPNNFSFFLAKVGVSILPVSAVTQAGGIPTAIGSVLSSYLATTIYENMYEFLFSTKVSLKISSDVKFEKPLCEFFRDKGLYIPATATGSAPGAIDNSGEIILNKAQILSGGTNFDFKVEGTTRTGALATTAGLLVEFRMTGFLLEKPAN